MNTQRVLATFVVAVLAASTISAVGVSFPIVQFASAQAVTIETSADDNGGTFFGEGVLQVVINDPSADDDDTQETITVNIDADPDTGTSGSGSFTVAETSASSGRFEFFLTQADANDVANSALDAINTNGADTYETTLGQAVGSKDAPVIQFGPSSATGEDLVVDSDLFEETSFDITVGNVEVSVDYDEMDGELSLDRETSYGSDNLVHMFILDNDANLNPTATDSFTVTDADLDTATGHLFTVEGGTFVDDVTFTETGDNTASFEAIIQLNTTDSAADDEFDAADEAIQLQLNDKALYSDVDSGFNTSTSTSSVSFSIDDVDGEFDDIGALTFGSELKLTLRDADRNIDSEDDETIDNAVVVSVETTGGDDETLDMAETGDNTGVFNIDLSNDELRVTFLSDGETPTDNNGILELRESDITEDISVQYTDPEDDDSGSSVTSLLTLEMTLQNGAVDLPETTGVNDDFTFTLTDADLNDNPRTRDSYSFTLEEVGGSGDFANLFNLTRGGEDLGELANLEFTVEGDAVDFGNNTPDIVYTLTETGINTGIFTVDIDMEDIANHGNNGNALDLDDGDEVEITYNDLMGDTSRESSDSISIGKANTGVDFSRTTLPIPPGSTDATIDALGSGTVVTTLVVTDPDENELTNAEDDLGFTLGTGANQFEIEVETDSGTLTVTTNGDYTGTNIPGTTTQLDEIMGALADIDLSETGKTTGVFDDELNFVDNANIDESDWHNMEITITYHDADGDEESAGITFRGNDGSVSVDQNSAKSGTMLTVTVEDQDLNLDDDEAEEFDSSNAATGDYLVAVETEDDDIDQTNTETFRETGPDTGIFTAEFEVGTDIIITELPDGDDEVTQSTNILITYNDEIDSTGGSGDELEVNVPVVSSTGAIQITPELVGPGTELTVLIIDADLDQDSSGTDNYEPDDPDSDNFFVSFRSDRSEVDEASPDLDETGPNTGVFEFTIELVTDEEDCQDDDLSAARYDATGGSEPSIGACPGDLISVRYEDEQGGNGQSTTVSQLVEVKSWDPEFVADKPDGYAVGDRVTITISDPDANTDPDIADSLTDLRVFSTSDAVGEELSALETGKSTGVFRLSFTVSSDTASGAITVKQGDRVTVEYTDEFPADFEEEEEDKDFSFSINIAGQTGQGATTPSEPELKDVTGKTLNSLAVGQQAVLTTNIVNNNDESRPFVALVEVRDSSGITVFLAWQTGTLNPSGQAEVGLSWTPEDAGDYEVRTFVISDLANPQILSEIAKSNISVSG